MNDLILLLSNFIDLFVASAPWLLLGLLVAGIMHELVPIALLEKHMGQRSFGAIVKAAFIGAPLPLCSCGVIPAALGLRRSGASKPSTVSFLVATPETGVDSISVSYALLGPLFAIVRPIAAIISAIYAGLVVKWLTRQEIDTRQTVPKAVSTCCSSGPNKDSLPAQKVESQAASSCCASETKIQQPEKSCCAEKNHEDTMAAPSHGISNKFSRVMQFSFGKLLNDILLWLTIGLALAAAIQTWVPTDFLTRWGDGFIAMLVMALVGIPMYICATASTPIALGFLAAGLSPGAILVFMLAGPATNISTMGMIGKEMGKTTLLGYLFSVISASILLGYALNIGLSMMGITLDYSNVATHQHADENGWYLLAAVLLFLLIVKSLKDKWRQSHQPTPQTSCH